MPGCSLALGDDLRVAVGAAVASEAERSRRRGEGGRGQAEEEQRRRAARAHSLTARSGRARPAQRRAGSTARARRDRRGRSRRRGAGRASRRGGGSRGCRRRRGWRPPSRAPRIRGEGDDHVAGMGCGQRRDRPAPTGPGTARSAAGLLDHLGGERVVLPLDVPPGAAQVGDRGPGPEPQPPATALHHRPDLLARRSPGFEPRQWRAVARLEPADEVDPFGRSRATRDLPWSAVSPFAGRR